MVLTIEGQDFEHVVDGAIELGLSAGARASGDVYGGQANAHGRYARPAASLRREK